MFICYLFVELNPKIICFIYYRNKPPCQILSLWNEKTKSFIGESEVKKPNNQVLPMKQQLELQKKLKIPPIGMNNNPTKLQEIEPINNNTTNELTTQIPQSNNKTSQTIATLNNQKSISQNSTKKNIKNEPIKATITTTNNENKSVNRRRRKTNVNNNNNNKEVKIHDLTTDSGNEDFLKECEEAHEFRAKLKQTTKQSLIDCFNSGQLKITES